MKRTYTGYKDKFGKRIYSNDLVADKLGEVNRIEFWDYVWVGIDSQGFYAPLCDLAPLKIVGIRSKARRINR